MTKIDSVLNSIAEVRRQTPSAVVFVSFGKDSLALLDLLYPHFETLIAVFMSFVPGLEHIEKYRRWCAVRYPNVKWLEVPHWNLSYIRRSGMYCEPEPELRLKKLADVIAEVREATGVRWTFVGMKKSDSLNRRLMLMQYESHHYTNNGVCYPLAELTNKEVLAYLRAHKLPAPVSYGKGASNGLGFNLDCFLWLRENCPGDLEKIYQAFPPSRRILFEYDREMKENKTINRSETAELWRSEICFAAYNPRRITDEARRTLRKGLKTFGLVGGIVVNKKPENGGYTLVSGHQRLTEMDEIQHYPEKDYRVRVEVVSLSEKQEKELNILLNNPSAQGEWDFDRLAQIIPSIDYDVAGLTDADLAFLQPQPISGVEAPGFNDLDSFHIPVERGSERYESEKQRLTEEKRKTSEKAQAAALDHLAYLCLSFSSFEMKSEFCRRFDIPPMETQISGDEFGEYIERID